MYTQGHTVIHALAGGSAAKLQNKVYKNTGGGPNAAYP